MANADRYSLYILLTRGKRAAKPIDVVARKRKGGLCLLEWGDGWEAAVPGVVTDAEPLWGLCGGGIVEWGAESVGDGTVVCGDGGGGGRGGGDFAERAAAQGSRGKRAGAGGVLLFRRGGNAGCVAVSGR